MSKSPILSRAFYIDPPDRVARGLLGKLLVRRFLDESRSSTKTQRLTGRIVEVEAYFGLDDPAAHTYVGKTARNAVLFGPPGFAYVYFIYGMYFCLNISCEPDGHPGGVLLRALEPVEGLETMARLRGLPSTAKPRLLTSGPGRLCQALGILRETHNGIDVTSPRSGLHVEDDGFVPDEIAISPRIGISKAAHRPLRFTIAGNRFVSGRSVSG
jgi:DNA-3-methyladenine glycosylase